MFQTVCHILFPRYCPQTEQHLNHWRWMLCLGLLGSFIREREHVHQPAYCLFGRFICSDFRSTMCGSVCGPGTQRGPAGHQSASCTTVKVQHDFSNHRSTHFGVCVSGKSLLYPYSFNDRSIISRVCLRLYFKVQLTTHTKKNG